MRHILACTCCLCFCSGCCIYQKIGEAIGRAVGEAVQQALAQMAQEYGPLVIMDDSLTRAEQAVLEAPGPRPEFLPWLAGAEIARCAGRIGLVPTALPVQLSLLFHTVAD